MDCEIEPEAEQEERIALASVMQVTYVPPVRRVVPRSVYMRIQAWKASLHVSGFLYAAFGALCGMLVLYFLVNLVSSLLFNPGGVSTDSVAVVAISCLVGIGVALAEIKNCRESSTDRLEQAKRIAPVAPLSRANTAHLPPQESLVRPSSDANLDTKGMLRPASVHQAIPSSYMLRAVSSQPDIVPVEQLIRPAGDNHDNP